MSYFYLNMSVGKKGGAKAAYDYMTRNGKYEKAGKEDLLYHETQNLPSWAESPRDFWREEEKKKDGFRKIILALPPELSTEENIEMVKEFCAGSLSSFAYSFAIHENVGRLSGERNPHAHIMICERAIDQKREEPTRENYFKKSRTRKDGTISGGYKKSELFRGERKETLKQLKEIWALKLRKTLNLGRSDELIGEKVEEGEKATLHVGWKKGKEKRLAYNEKVREYDQIVRIINFKNNMLSVEDENIARLEKAISENDDKLIELHSQIAAEQERLENEQKLARQKAEQERQEREQLKLDTETTQKIRDIFNEFREELKKSLYIAPDVVPKGEKVVEDEKIDISPQKLTQQNVEQNHIEREQPKLDTQTIQTIEETPKTPNFEDIDKETEKIHAHYLADVRPSLADFEETTEAEPTVDTTTNQVQSSPSPAENTQNVADELPQTPPPKQEEEKELEEENKPILTKVSPGSFLSRTIGDNATSFYSNGVVSYDEKFYEIASFPYSKKWSTTGTKYVVSTPHASTVVSEEVWQKSFKRLAELEQTNERNQSQGLER